MGKGLKLEDFMGGAESHAPAANDVGRALDLWDAVWEAKGMLIDG